MSARDLDQLLGHTGRDPGCEAAFGILDRYCEAVHRGKDGARLFPEFVTHIRSCAACREDTEGLLAALPLMAERPRADDQV